MNMKVTKRPLGRFRSFLWDLSDALQLWFRPGYGSEALYAGRPDHPEDKTGIEHVPYRDRVALGFKILRESTGELVHRRGTP